MSREPGPTAPKGQPYDVAILGAGLAGTMLAAVLARHGTRVIVLDAGAHPRFAIGESTIPYTSMMMRLVAERYDVPEIKHLATFESVRQHVTTGCGIKRNFGFVYHREGKPQNPREVNQFAIPKALHTENHFFRQHIDAYMLAVAIRYGATVRQHTRVEDVDIASSGVTLGTTRGEEIKARYLVDASGHASPLARTFGLREEPTRFQHHSRSLFTHMVGVKPFDEVIASRAGYDHPSPWSQGTLHHLFDGGWMWVIPFNNHARSTNPLCSVGLNFDPRQFPKPDVDPEQEFRSFVARHPEIAEQFAGARAVRNWVSTDRLQYSSKGLVGDRFCLTSHAAGFVDALFSRGLTNTLEIVNALASRLLDAVADDDFSAERFAYVEELEQSLLNMNDDLVSSAYTSFKDFHLWNATFRIWGLGAVLATFVLQRIYTEFLQTRDPRVFDQLEEAHAARIGLPLPGDHGFKPLLAETVAQTRAVAAGTVDPIVAGDHLFGLLNRAEFAPPAFGFGDPKERYYHATLPKIISTLRWASAPGAAAENGLVRNGLTSFLRGRMRRGEFHPFEELRTLASRGHTSRLVPTEIVTGRAAR